MQMTGYTYTNYKELILKGRQQNTLWGQSTPCCWCSSQGEQFPPTTHLHNKWIQHIASSLQEQWHQDSFWGGKHAKLSSCNRNPCGNPFYDMGCSYLQVQPAERHWCCWWNPSCTALAVLLQNPSTKQLVVLPTLAPDVLIAAVLHQQSCVDTRALTIIAVLAKKKYQPPQPAQLCGKLPKTRLVKGFQKALPQFNAKW